jgi:putative tricarboxylic transport membrane protein
MTIESERDRSQPPPWLQTLARKNVLAGALFMSIAVLGLWLSRDYPIGTALRMGTGYVPRLLCWVLLALGACVLVQGLREAPGGQGEQVRVGWRPLILVTTSLALFALTLERLGLVVAILLLTGVGAYAARRRGLLETLLAALVLIALSWGIFIVGLQLTIRVWPEW